MEARVQRRQVQSIILDHDFGQDNGDSIAMGTNVNISVNQPGIVTRP